MIDEWKKRKYLGFPSNECSISFASAPISLSKRPMKLNVGVSAGQCRPESIYLHTSTGLVEARIWANHILVSLKSLLHQTWVNGLLMDTQRQVLFLLAGALDKKPKATAWLKAILLTKHCRICKSIEWQKPFLFIYLLFVIPSWKLVEIQFKIYIYFCVGGSHNIAIYHTTIHQHISLVCRYFCWKTTTKMTDK